jgi:hypothetical protein
MSAIALGAVISACAGMLELKPMRFNPRCSFQDPADAGGCQVRAGGTFQYANTAAMYGKRFADYPRGGSMVVRSIDRSGAGCREAWRWPPASS